MRNVLKFGELKKGVDVSSDLNNFVFSMINFNNN